uniref:Uncharacterized protein n=1 Tax=Rhizophora mucronata TaxID=61149 RepID=A0A2P2R0T6_RHIMU
MIPPSVRFSFFPKIEIGFSFPSRILLAIQFMFMPLFFFFGRFYAISI